MEDIFTGSLEIPKGPIGRVLKTIGKWFIRSLVPANIVGFIFVGIVLLLMAYIISFGPIQLGPISSLTAVCWSGNKCIRTALF
jgi:hypothetical protein